MNSFTTYRLAAVRCLTPVCARLTTRHACEDPPERCPVCAGPVEPLELQRPKGRDEGRDQ